jgi:thiamine biosynthesis lipoprotein
MNRREMLGILGASAGLGAMYMRPLYRRRAVYVERWSWAMGQPVRLVLFHESEGRGLDAAQVAFAELRRVERKLSRFDDASDLAELNRHAGKGPLRVDADLLAVLEAAGRFRRATAGSFDIAVEPLMRVWGFREPRKAAPSVRELGAAREAVRATVVRLSGDRVELPVAHTALDLGGIGVGYGLDRAGAVLRGHGVTAALLDVSGDLLAIGAPPGQPGWNVDIVDPRRPQGILATALIRDAALATSANTVAMVRLGRELRGHVMDPARGAPADRLVQATVQAATGMAADALSTGFLVAGRLPAGAERGWQVRPA